MRYFALYQQQFSGMPQPLGNHSHALVGSVLATDLEDAFTQLQAENMLSTLARQIESNYTVRHTSMSVGDILIDERGRAQMVQVVGFSPVEPSSPSQRVELALHLAALELTRTAGWKCLFADDGPELARLIVERLRHGASAKRGAATPRYVNPAP